MQMFVGGGNAIFLLLTVLFTGFLVMVGFFSWNRRNLTVVRVITGVGASILGVYFALLITFALASRERVLGPGQIKWFCGFYLDCHLGVSVAKAESVKNLMTASGPVVAKGVFKIVTLQLHNSAKNPAVDMTMYHPVASLIDSKGVHYQRNPEAELAIAADRSFASPLGETLLVSHRPVYATVVFDIPPDAPMPRLSVEEGFFVDRAIELVLVNDDNSILHEPTLLALSESSARPPTSYLRNRARYLPSPRARLASR